MKTNKELLKTIAITILITSNISFLAGIYYHKNQSEGIRREVNSQVESLKAELSDPKPQQ